MKQNDDYKSILRSQPTTFSMGTRNAFRGLLRSNVRSMNATDDMQVERLIGI